jgi:hypothetical protein
VKTGGYVFLTAKAADARIAARWLLALCEEFGTDSLHDRLIYGVVWGVARYNEIVMRAGRYMTPSEIYDLQVAVRTCLMCYFSLRKEALAAGLTALWKPKPKMHMWWHLVFDFVQATKMNPRATWCYGGEDFVGRIKRLAKSCHRTSLVSSLVKRYLVGKKMAMADYLREVMR